MLGAVCQGTATYILSRQCEDFFAIYVFQLHPVPFCGAPNFLACSAEKSASVQVTANV